VTSSGLSGFLLVPIRRLVPSNSSSYWSEMILLFRRHCHYTFDKRSQRVVIDIYQWFVSSVSHHHHFSPYMFGIDSQYLLIKLQQSVTAHQDPRVLWIYCLNIQCSGHGRRWSWSQCLDHMWDAFDRWDYGSEIPFLTYVTGYDNGTHLKTFAWEIPLNVWVIRKVVNYVSFFELRL